MWCAVDVDSNFIFDFDIYSGKSMHTLHGCGLANSEINLEHKVVINLTTRFDHKGHVIVLDNFFTSVVLFWDLERHRIYPLGQ